MDAGKDKIIDLGINMDESVFQPREVSRRMVEYILEHKITPFSPEYHDFRRACLRQLRQFSTELVTELARIILFEYGLRLLSYELVYYHSAIMLDVVEHKKHFRDEVQTLS